MPFKLINIPFAKKKKHTPRPSLLFIKTPKKKTFEYLLETDTGHIFSLCTACNCLLLEVYLSRPPNPRSTICSTEDQQQHLEQIDDIQIQRDGSPYVVIVSESLDQVISVVDNIARKNQCSQAAIDHGSDLSHGEEYLQQS